MCNTSLTNLQQSDRAALPFHQFALEEAPQPLLCEKFLHERRILFADGAFSIGWQRILGIMPAEETALRIHCAADAAAHYLRPCRVRPDPAYQQPTGDRGGGAYV